MAPLLPSNSLALTVCDIHFCIEYSQNSFSHYPAVGLFWSAKYLIFGQKPPTRTAHYTFLECRHPEDTKNPYYVLFPEWSRKP